jgi:hypothetical protein
MTIDDHFKAIRADLEKLGKRLLVLEAEGPRRELAARIANVEQLVGELGTALIGAGTPVEIPLKAGPTVTWELGYTLAGILGRLEQLEQLSRPFASTPSDPSPPPPAGAPPA